MELHQAIHRRRMVRSFDGQPVDQGLLRTMVDDSLRSPTAGNTGGTAWLVLVGPEETGPYWEHATTGEWRATSRRWPGLSRAPVVALSLAAPQAYLTRYGEPDKAKSGLADQGRWPVPYWFGDAAFATMTLLLSAVSAGLGACFLGNFRGEQPLLSALSVPDRWRLFGAVLLGHADGEDHRSPSLEREGPARAARLHWGRWGHQGKPEKLPRSPRSPN